MWSTGEGNGKSLQYSCLENPMNSMKRQNDPTKTSRVLLQRVLAMPVGQPKMGGLWWRDLTECGPLEKGMANHFSILAQLSLATRGEDWASQCQPKDAKWPAPLPYT